MQTRIPDPGALPARSSGVLTRLAKLAVRRPLLSLFPAVLSAAALISSLASVTAVAAGTSGISGAAPGYTVQPGRQPLSFAGAAAVEDAWTLNPDALARFPVRNLQIGSVSLSPSTTFGIRLQEELAIPDLGSDVRSGNPFDAGAIAQDIQASNNRLLAQYPRRGGLKMNFLKVDTPDYRIDLTQHPSRTGLRFHHLASGLRIEAERRFINSGTNLFIGIRLMEDRRFDPTIGCSYNSNAQVESRLFCGFRLRIGI